MSNERKLKKKNSPKKFLVKHILEQQKNKIKFERVARKDVYLWTHIWEKLFQWGQLGKEGPL